MKLKKVILPALLSLLILLLASSLAQAYSGFYYVIPSSVSLRECAANNCAPLDTVYQGDKVEILERTATGWSRVRLVDKPSIGWIANNLLSYSPDLKAKAEPPYYVNTSVALRDKPNPNANVITTLNANDQVEMLGVGLSGWAQVRDLRSSVVGWVDPRHLSRVSQSSSESSPRRRAPAHKAAPKVKKEKKAPEEAPKVPSAM
jgi:uncharacterized protein YgiM (DUF1202 family)